VNPDKANNTANSTDNRFMISPFFGAAAVCWRAEVE